ncbi:ABC transporter permease [Hansschlegelia sp. KR7-227]|jgi:NitT/TauT family transport system permease protein|uniref:ABC transporter permease n=1 Tax=Hansschlegelia sp. KR7-227 TaxID=3400914 RepID=UPI003C043E8E
MTAATTLDPSMAPTPKALKRRSKFERAVSSPKFWRGLAGLLVFLLIWEIGSYAKSGLGIDIPFFGKLPAPTAVAAAAAEVVVQSGYWMSWIESFKRVIGGFIIAMIIGIPFGLALAVNKYFRDVFFPPFEVLRPIPPLAWVPASLIFWPTNEMSIIFVTFLGAFFTIVINVLGGARTIDVRYLRAAQSMGASQWHLFSRIILPGTLPSIFTGAAVGMGITWNVVLAAEMVSGGGSQAGGGLGFFIWSSYMGGSMEQIIVGMISIGIAGYLSSAAIRVLGEKFMPWRRAF